MALLLLPLELIVKILLYLDVEDAYTIQAVNHGLRDIYQTSIELQYALECRVAHVLDNPNCHLPIGERLEMLRRREIAWRSLNPTSSQMVPMPKYTDLYGIHRNHYIVGRSGYGLYSLTMKEFEENSFRHIPLDGLVHFCCCMDEHDLIACLVETIHSDSDFHEFRIKLLQYSTDMAHPLAAEPMILVCRELSWARDAAMEVCGENLVLTLTLEGEEGDPFTLLYTFNWKTGDSKCLPMFVSHAGIIILAEDLVLIPDTSNWLLHIYYIPSSPVNGPLKSIQRLRLPALRGGTTAVIDFHEFRSAPNPTGGGTFPRHIPSSLPFITQPETALIYLRWDIDLEPLSLIVHRHSIMNLLPSRADWLTMAEPRTFDWDAWGPPVALWDDMQVIYSYITATNGQRYIQTTNHYDGNLFLQDYNKYSANRCSTEILQTFAAERTFLDPITSELPFTRVYSGMQHGCAHWSLADGIAVGTWSDLSSESEADDTDNGVKIFYFN